MEYRKDLGKKWQGYWSDRDRKSYDIITDFDMLNDEMLRKAVDALSNNESTKERMSGLMKIEILPNDRANGWMIKAFWKRPGGAVIETKSSSMEPNAQNWNANFWPNLEDRCPSFDMSKYRMRSGGPAFPEDLSREEKIELIKWFMADIWEQANYATR